MRKILSTWGIIIILLVSVIGTAAAQTGDDPSVTPTPVETSQPAESTTYLHPIVQVLSAYFGRTTRTMMPTPTPTETPTETSTETPTVDPSATATETPTETPTPMPVMGPEEYAQEIAMYHEAGMGFGVLVKLYAMAEASVEKCVEELSKQTPTPETTAASDGEPTPATCEPLTVEQLVNEFKGGSGMGQLFKEYGKPALLGVGHVKKAMKNLPVVESTPAPVVTATPEPPAGSADLQNQKSNNGKGIGKSNKPVKIKTPNPRGAKK